MASIKIKFRPSTIHGNEGSIYFQVIQKRTIRQIPTGYKVYPEEWDAGRQDITIPRNSPRVDYLKAVLNNIRWDLNLFSTICDRTARNPYDYSADNLVDEFLYRKKQNSLFNFMNNTISRLQSLGKLRTSETYQTTLSSFRNFRNGEDIMLHAINSELIERYEAFLSGRGVVHNTISFYMRILRAIYNRAVEKGLIEQRYPFRHVYTGVAKTAKRAISLNVIRNIKDLDCKGAQKLEFARDMFLFSFYTRGMAPIDMAFLKKENLKGNILSYKRQKTGQTLYIGWEKCMQEIIDRHPTETNSPYLLPIIKMTAINPRQQYKSYLSSINNQLKTIARLIRLDVPLTMYVARHSWASIAHSRHIPLSVISEGMGHDSETTTQIYLASINTTAINKANRQIINLLKPNFRKSATGGESQEGFQ